MDQLIAEGSYSNYNYNNVKRWCRHIEILGMDKIFFPINIRNTHWTLAVIFLPDRAIRYYDSANGNGDVYTKTIARWLHDEATTRDQREWTVSPSACSRVPQQLNSYDCGVFSSFCADRISLDLELDYSQSDMKALQIKMGTDVLRGTLIVPLVAPAPR